MDVIDIPPFFYHLSYKLNVNQLLAKKQEAD